ncbi:unnamed protein product [Protopolystoma xenopodis]|uniref:Uncharacterized protein n=1 Tax=Protopolystoma xenopodis TaxID=117903 RepID=A0A448WTK1_9PLAT|nr:unnamed protein product [Protopolystoma xenopodis]
MAGSGVPPSHLKRRVEGSVGGPRVYLEIEVRANKYQTLVEYTFSCHSTVSETTIDEKPLRNSLRRFAAAAGYPLVGCGSGRGAVSTRESQVYCNSERMKDDSATISRNAWADLEIQRRLHRKCSEHGRLFDHCKRYR